MPQGLPKKIQLQSLLTNLALQFGDPPPAGNLVNRPRRLLLRQRRGTGLPLVVSAPAPPKAYLRRQTYSISRPTPNSRASASTCGAVSMRLSASSLNSREYRRRSFIHASIPMECALFHCLKIGGHSNMGLRAKRVPFSQTRAGSWRVRGVRGPP